MRHTGRQAHAIFELKVLIARINQIHLISPIVLALAGKREQIAFLRHRQRLAPASARALDINLHLCGNA